VNHLRLLLRKELWLLRNSHFRTRKQAAATLGVVLLILLATAGIAGATYGWLRPLVSDLPPALRGPVVRPLLIVVYTWLAMLLFASTVQESRNRFFLTPDLSLLVSTPVNPLLLFSSRFVLFVFLSPTSLLWACLLAFGPLIGVGLIAGAPWYYYPLLVPITYVYLLVPAALGLALIMSLMRVLPPRRLFHLAAAFNAVLAVAWVAFILGDQTAVLSRLLGAVERLGPAFSAVLPLQGAADLLAGLLGYRPGGLGGPLSALLISAALVFAACMLVVGWAYYPCYERLQAGEWRPASKGAVRQAKAAGTGRGGRVSGLWLLLLSQWKMAWRNHEVAQGALGIGAVLAGYVVTMGQLAAGAGALLALVHIAVISFFGNLAVQIMFMPFAVVKDRSVLCRQYWPLKAAPVPGRQVVWSLFLAQCLPALPLGLLVLFVANLATGASLAVLILSLGLMLFVASSAAAVFQLTSLLEISALGKEVPLLARVGRELAPVCYSALVLLPAAVGYCYQDLGALSFMHAWPRDAVVSLSVLLTLLLAVFALVQSLRSMNGIWQAIEIS
jgi:hypothetical protein